MDKDLVQEIKRKTKSWAVSNGFLTDAEDIAQYVLHRISMNRQADIALICIDYVRSAYGRCGIYENKNRITRLNEKKNYLEIDDSVYADETQSLAVPFEGFDFSVYQGYLDSKDRAMVTLRFKWGMTEKEIGDCFGVSESRICQKLREINNKLRTIISQEQA